jgi:hypothetical protein
LSLEKSQGPAFQKNPESSTSLVDPLPVSIVGLPLPVDVQRSLGKLKFPTAVVGDEIALTIDLDVAKQ